MQAVITVFFVWNENTWDRDFEMQAKEDVMPVGDWVWSWEHAEGEQQCVTCEKNLNMQSSYLSCRAVRERLVNNFTNNLYTLYFE
jgi:hypothetical protein